MRRSNPSLQALAYVVEISPLRGEYMKRFLLAFL
jgi:hypothetical protein